MIRIEFRVQEETRATFKMETEALLQFSFTIQKEKSFEVLLERGQDICAKLHSPIYKMEAKTWKLLAMERGETDSEIHLNLADSDYVKVQKIISGKEDLAHFLVFFLALIC